MKKEDIICELQRKKLDINRFIVINDAAMVLYNIIDDTKKIEICTLGDYKDFLVKKYYNGVKVYRIGRHIYFDNDYVIQDRNFIYGIPVQTITDLIAYKENQNCRKDKKDLNLILKKYKR